MKSEGEDGIGLATCSERGRMMTAWRRWSGNLKGREQWDDLKPHGEEQWKKNPGKRGRPAGRKSGAPAAQDRARWREEVTTLCASWRGEN